MKYARGGMTSLDYLIEIQRLEADVAKLTVENEKLLNKIAKIQFELDDVVSEWVSVKDRLPEQYTDVIVFTKDGIIDVDCLEHIMSWGEEDFCKYGDNVTHWMPLPTPPQRVKMMQNE